MSWERVRHWLALAGIISLNAIWMAVMENLGGGWKYLSYLPTVYIVGDWLELRDRMEKIRGIAKDIESAVGQTHIDVEELRRRHEERMRRRGL